MVWPCGLGRDCKLTGLEGVEGGQAALLRLVRVQRDAAHPKLVQYRSEQMTPVAPAHAQRSVRVGAVPGKHSAIRCANHAQAADRGYHG